MTLSSGETEKDNKNGGLGGEIVVTEDMIEAGVSELSSHNCAGLISYHDAVLDIFISMSEVQSLRL